MTPPHSVQATNFSFSLALRTPRAGSVPSSRSGTSKWIGSPCLSALRSMVEHDAVLLALGRADTPAHLLHVQGFRQGGSGQDQARRIGHVEADAQHVDRGQHPDRPVPEAVDDALALLRLGVGVQVRDRHPLGLEVGGDGLGVRDVDSEAEGGPILPPGRPGRDDIAHQLLAVHRGAQGRLVVVEAVGGGPGLNRPEQLGDVLGARGEGVHRHQEALLGQFPDARTAHQVGEVPAQPLAQRRCGQADDRDHVPRLHQCDVGAVQDVALVDDDQPHPIRCATLGDGLDARHHDIVVRRIIGVFAAEHPHPQLEGIGRCAPPDRPARCDRR